MAVSPGQDPKQRVIAVVEYDYAAKEDDEIDLLKGQIIQNINQKPGGWWEGTISSTGKRGMFPDNFVRVVENHENSKVVLRDKSYGVRRRCKAIYSYVQVNEDELSLGVGDVIDFLAEVEEGWWRGKLNNKIGVFPSNFVVAIPSSPILASKRPNSNCSEENTISNKKLEIVASKSVDDYRAPDLPPRPIREFCRVEFSYSPQNDDELELSIGEIITIVDKMLPDKGWWKGEVNGKIGVFPDNFVKLIPQDVLEKDIQTLHSKPIVKETNNKKAMNSYIPPISPPNSLDLLNDLLNKTPIQGGNVAAQRMSLENINIELITQSASSDQSSRNLVLNTGESKNTIENIGEKKVPPPLPTKKPTIPGKKSLTNTTCNVLSNLRQKVKNVEQKSILSQDANDGSQSSKVSGEARSNLERASSMDELLDSDSDFDKVQRASILWDMRAGRVKAPKRRPPSIAANLMTESIIKNSNETEEAIREPKTESFSNCEKQVKPKSIEWGIKTVPWMDELKASQTKMKSSPQIEPRKTLVNINNGVAIEEKRNVSIKNVKTKEVNTDSIVSFSKESVEKYEKENELNKSTVDIASEKILLKDETEDSDEPKSPKTQHSKLNVKPIKTVEAKSTSALVLIKSNETPDLTVQDGKKVADLEKRIEILEANVQSQQKLIEDIQRMLQNETNRVELLKNQLDKYAQCVTQV